MGLVAACGGETAEPVVEEVSQLVTFNAVSDGRAVPEVGIRFDGGPIVGTTNREGQLTVRLHGVEGRRFAIGAECPRGYRVAKAPTAVQLRSFSTTDDNGEPQRILFRIECPPSLRYAAVIVRAGSYANMPIMRNGREVAKTDRSGVAHLGFYAQPGDRFQFELDTSAHPKIRPQNPSSREWTMPDEDKWFVFDADELLEERRPPTVIRTRRRPRPRGPMLPVPI